MQTRRKQMFIGAVVLAAASTATYAGTISHAPHTYQALGILALAAVTSRMKVKLPGLNGNMSVNLPFLLAGIVSLSAAESMAITCISATVQCWPKRGAQWKTEQMVFNIGMMALASSLAALLFRAAGLPGPSWAHGQMALTLAAGTLFLGQTVPVATIIGLTGGEAIARLWSTLAHLSFPYYVLSAGVCSMMQTVNHQLGWGAALAVFPVMYGIHRCHVTYFSSAVETIRTVPRTCAASAGA
jgi:hypothetical protein